MHGLDWNELREHYGSLLDDAVTRWDVNFIIGELIGELNASHTYVGGGDTESARRRRVGLLGVDWALENGAYRIARIVRGAPWDAEVAVAARRARCRHLRRRLHAGGQRRTRSTQPRIPLPPSRVWLIRRSR